MMQMSSQTNTNFLVAGSIEQTVQLIDLEFVIELVKDMKILYGRQYTAQWSGISDAAIAERFYRLLKDISLDQFQYGKNIMESSGKIPTMPEFKEWCLKFKPRGHHWYSASEAWALCLNYEKDSTSMVTTQAIEAFDKVKTLFQVEGQKAAYFSFKGFYERVVERDQGRGLPQVRYVKPKAIKSPRDTRVTDPWTPEMRSDLKVNLAKIYKAINMKPKQFTGDTK